MSKLLSMMMSGGEKGNTVNLIKVGSLTDNNGVISGFSADNYLKANINLNKHNSWNIYLNLIGDSVYGGLFGGNIDYSIRFSGQSRNLLYLSSNGSSFDISNPSGSGTSLPTNCFVNIGFSGTEYFVKYSTDETNWSTTFTKNSSTKITTTEFLVLGKLIQNQYTYFRGSIKIPKSFIVLDNEQYNFKLV